MSSPQQKLFEKLIGKQGILSKAIRERDGTRCISCGSNKGNQAGHFLSRTHKSIALDPRAINVQCPKCNGKPPWGLNGNYYFYGLALDRKYGKGTSKELAELSKKSKVWYPKELETLLNALKQGGLRKYQLIYQKLVESR